MGKYQSDQMGQTANLLAYAFDGSNPSLHIENQIVIVEIYLFFNQQKTSRYPRQHLVELLAGHCFYTKQLIGNLKRNFYIALIAPIT